MSRCVCLVRGLVLRGELVLDVSKLEDRLRGKEKRGKYDYTNTNAGRDGYVSMSRRTDDGGGEFA